MSKRYDICTPRENEKSGKTFWVRIGTAFEGKNGIQLYFDAYPVNGKASLFEPKERAGAQPSRDPDWAKGAGNDEPPPF